MKILLISDRDDIKELLINKLILQGIEIIQYWHPVKAMDNLEEMSPDIIMFNAEDFPRHWKTFASYIKSTEIHDAPIILLTGEKFDQEEASKATALGIRAFVDSSLNDAAQIKRVKKLIARYRKLPDGRRFPRFIPQSIDKVGFLFSHPDKHMLVFGKILDISLEGLGFLPYDTSVLLEIREKSLLRHCSLRVGDKLFNVDCTVISTIDGLHLAFIAPTDELKKSIKDYFLEAAIDNEISVLS
ncbi:PilZ domain-containing protein [Spirochaetia bacterium 38H-sp]|uniref:PilZ domain-containing protein n=1 Tax=Rarispira pelagica TaxID=3141764 RepID=A0ABU9UBV0_9SPIR